MPRRTESLRGYASLILTGLNVILLTDKKNINLLLLVIFFISHH